MTPSTPSPIGQKAASRGIALAAGLACALVAQVATAGCPPGYRQKGEQCMPGPVSPHRTYTAHSNVSSSVPAMHAGHAPSEITKAVDRRKVKPQPGTPIALNPQPIPPGHAAFRLPPPGAPIEKVGR